MLLDWAAQSGNLNTIAADKVKTTTPPALPKNTKGKVFFDSLLDRASSFVKETPEISDDNKSLTLVYTKPFADWQYDMTDRRPGARRRREGPRASPTRTEAKDAFVKASRTRTPPR